MATALDPALNPDVFGMQPRLPTMPKPTPLGAAEERLAGTEKELGAALKQQAEFAGAQAERETRQAATKAKGEAEILGRQAEEMRAAEEPIRVAEEEKMKARFSPTRETATEMAALYSLVGVLGFAIGRGGKNNAMQAMSAMNGMLEGYRQGSVDRFNQEKKLFDSNLKSMTDNINMLTNRLQRIAQLSTVDKLKAEQELAVTLAEGNADFVKQNINKFGLPATIQYLKQVQTAAQRAVDKEREFERKAEQKARDAAEAREREKDRQAFLKIMQGERIGAQRDLQKERLEDLEKRQQERLSQRGPGAAQITSTRVMQQDVGNAKYNLQDLKSLAEQTGKLPGGSVAFANKFTGDISSMIQRYAINQVMDEGLQGMDALMLNLAFDIASAQSGGRGQLSDAKVRAVVQQMPLDAQPESTKATKWAALMTRVDEANKSIEDPKKRVEIPEELRSYYMGKRAAPSAAGPYSDEEKERRYQEWKARQGAQQ